MVKITTIFQNTINFFSKKPDNAAIVSRAKQYSGEYSRDLPFSRFYDYYHQTPSVKRNINSLHRRWMGSSMEVQSQSKTFDSMWKLWNDTTNFIPKLKEAALDALITGTMLIERQYYGSIFANVEHIPTKTLWHVFRDEFANMLSIWQLVDGDTKQLAPKNVPIFTINNPERDGIGKSAMYALAVPQKVAGKVDELGNPINPERYLPSILDVKTRLNFAHMEIAEKQAKARFFVSLKGVKDKDRQTQIEKDLEDEASSKFITVTDGDVDVKGIEFKSQVGNEKYLNDIDTQINQGSGFPGNVIDKGGEMGYASSQTPMQDLSSSIEDMQNDLSEWVQHEFFKILCEQWGLDFEEVQPQLVFKTFVEKVTFEQLIKIPPHAPLAPMELRGAYKEFIPGMDDKMWKEYEEKMESQRQEQLAEESKGGKPANKNPRPDVEKGAPKPDKAIELHPLLKNPKALEKYIQDEVEKKAAEFSTYFALPPTDSQPYKAPTPDVTNPETLQLIKQMLQDFKDGKISEEDVEKKVDEMSQEADRVSFWIKELKRAHKDWTHDQVVAVAIKKSQETAKPNKKRTRKKA